MELNIIPKDFIKEVNIAMGNVYIVGGWVRDRELDLKSKDLDIVITGLSYTKICEILSRYGDIKEVGESFGVIKWKLEGQSEPIDVALPRVEKSTGTGHKDFKVDFGPHISIEEDLSRRDFTMNAIAINLNNDKVIDPYNGIKAIKNKSIIRVSDSSFEDDPLRMLRAIQFMARFNMRLDNPSINSMNKNVYRIKHISNDRIAIELGKLFGKGKLFGNALCLLRDTGLFDRIFPELHFPVIDLDFLPNNIDLRFASFFYQCKLKSPARDKVEVINEAIDDMKLQSTGLDKKKVIRLIKHSKIEAVYSIIPFYKWNNFDINKSDVRKFIAKNLDGKIENLFDLIQIWRLDVINNFNSSKDNAFIMQIVKAAFEIYKDNDPLNIKDLCIDGQDIINYTQAKGKQIGEILYSCLELVLENPKSNSNKELKRYLKEKFYTSTNLASNPSI